MEGNLQESWKKVPSIPWGVTIAFVLLLVFGGIVFLTGLRQDPVRAWQSYLVNFLFWGGLAQGAVVFAAIYHVVGGHWGPSVRRLAEGAAAFLPVGFLLFLPLLFGLQPLFEGVQELNPRRGAWFDYRFIFIRGGLGLGSITVLSLLFVYYSLRPEVGLALEKGIRAPRWFYAWLTDGWEGSAFEIERSRRGMDVSAAGVLIAYPITYTFMAFDLIMALDPFWYSSLFGIQFFVSTFYLGLAGLTLVTILLRWCFMGSVITSDAIADLGKLLLGFDLTYLAMLWSQYIVIWYGNLPEETEFILIRLWEEPWSPLSWGALAMSSFIPFVVLLSSAAKRIPAIMFSMGLLISAGLWLERYVLVVPSLWHFESVPFGWLEIGVTVGFLGATGLSYCYFLRNFPVLPFFQPGMFAAPGTTEPLSPLPGREYSE